jgi:hypothetical protein
MGNNSSDINKNEEPPLTSKYRTQNRRRQIAIEIQVLDRFLVPFAIIQIYQFSLFSD